MDARAWTLLPAHYPEVIAAEKVPRAYWSHAGTVIALPLLLLVPAIQGWTGLHPSLCAAAVVVHLLMYGSEVYLDASGRLGTVAWSTIAITTNAAVTATICGSPGHFVAPVWGLYFVYLFVPIRVAPPSGYVLVLITGAPLATGLAWQLLGTSTWAESAASLVPVSVISGLTYAFLTVNVSILRSGRLLAEEERLAQAREAEKRILADDLHDSLGAALAEVALWQDIGKRVEGEERRAALERAERRLQDALVELRGAVSTLGEGSVSSEMIAGLLRSRLSGLCQASGSRSRSRATGSGTGSTPERPESSSRWRRKRRPTRSVTGVRSGSTCGSDGTKG